MNFFISYQVPKDKWKGYLKGSLLLEDRRKTVASATATKGFKLISCLRHDNPCSMTLSSFLELFLWLLSEQSHPQSCFATTQCRGKSVTSVFLSEH